MKSFEGKLLTVPSNDLCVLHCLLSFSLCVSHSHRLSSSLAHSVLAVSTLSFASLSCISEHRRRIPVQS